MEETWFWRAPERRGLAAGAGLLPALARCGFRAPLECRFSEEPLVSAQKRDRVLQSDISLLLHFQCKSESDQNSFEGENYSEGLRQSAHLHGRCFSELICLTSCLHAATERDVNPRTCIFIGGCAAPSRSGCESLY